MFGCRKRPSGVKNKSIEVEQMTRKYKRPISETREVSVILRAEKCRESFVGIREKFDPLTFIEMELNRRPEFDYSAQSALIIKGDPLEAVTVVGVDSLTIIATDDLLNRALSGCGSANFNLCHEIGHTELHASSMMSGQQLFAAKESLFAKGIVGGTPKQECEADTFAIGLLVPFAAVHSVTIERELVQRYGVGWSTARRAIEVYRRLRPAIERKRRGKPE